MRRMRRRAKDRLAITGIGFLSSFGLLILFLIFSFVFSNGAGLLSWEFLSGDYLGRTFNTQYDGTLPEEKFQRPATLSDDVFYSETWGVGFSDGVDHQENGIILVAHVDSGSPFAGLPDKNHPGQSVSIEPGQTLVKVILGENVIVYGNDGARVAAEKFEQSVLIKDMVTATSGGGIRGSIWTTVILIVLTLLIALPLGIFSAVYFHEFAPRTSKIVQILRRMIEMLSGMPSIIFGLMGATVFIPFTSTLTSADGGNLLSGAMTLSIIVLPLIISATEEALSVVPDDFRRASLALGANKTQTTFKVVIKSAIPGILAGTILAIGRIIGESAALIYAVGTAIKDEIILTERSTSLAVHIWSVMAGEVPDFEMASAISIVILLVVLVLSLLVKAISRKWSIDPSLR